MQQDDTPTPTVQCAELELVDSTVIYDRTNHQAWIQSDDVVDPTAMV